MSALSRIVLTPATAVTAPELSARMFDLAMEAKRAGYGVAAEHLLYLASDVLEPSAQEPTPR